MERNAEPNEEPSCLQHCLPHRDVLIPFIDRDLDLEVAVNRGKSAAKELEGHYLKHRCKKRKHKVGKKNTFASLKGWNSDTSTNVGSGFEHFHPMLLHKKGRPAVLSDNVLISVLRPWPPLVDRRMTRRTLGDGGSWLGLPWNVHQYS